MLPGSPIGEVPITGWEEKISKITAGYGIDTVWKMGRISGIGPFGPHHNTFTTVKKIPDTVLYVAV